VNGTLHRLPVLSTDRPTAYFPQPKRGAEALDGFGLLTLFAGVLVHDPWSAYERYQWLHAFCHAHHLREHRSEILRFLTELRIPFDNNQAERDLCMPKIKQKVSGCCRSDTGAEDFAILRSYLSTRRKQSDDTLQLARPDLPAQSPNAPIGVAE